MARKPATAPTQERDGTQRAGVNVVVIVGRLCRPASERELPSGTRLASLEVTVSRPGSRADTVPVVCFDAPAAVSDLDAETEVAVVGRVRRRFFRHGTATQSRTEVEASAVVPTSRLRQARQAIGRAAGAIDEVL